MKKYLLDTNILIFLVKNSKFGQFFEQEYQLKYPNDIYYSHISLGRNILLDLDFQGTEIRETILPFKKPKS